MATCSWTTCSHHASLFVFWCYLLHLLSEITPVLITNTSPAGIGLFICKSLKQIKALISSDKSREALVIWAVKFRRKYLFGFQFVNCFWLCGSEIRRGYFLGFRDGGPLPVHKTAQFCTQLKAHSTCGLFVRCPLLAIMNVPWFSHHQITGRILHATL